MKKQKMLIGWGTRDVTPNGKVSLRGQFHVRITDDIHDPLTTTALALEAADGSEQAIIVSLDAVGITDYVTAGCRKVLSEKLPEFNSEKLFISATHTHTAPGQPGPILSAPPEIKGVMSAEEYGDFLIEKIGEAAIEAWNNRKPGALSWGKGHATIGFNRRVSYFDGSTVMYGKIDVPEFSHIEGYEDHGVDMLFTYDSEYKLTGMILNVPCPSQCTEGAYFVSADYWHETREAIRARHGRGIYILPQCAAAGDQSPRTMVNRQADARMLELKGYGNDYNTARRQDIADKISAAVDEVLATASKDIRNEAEFGHTVTNLDLEQRKATVNDLKNAEKEVALWKAKLEELKDADPASVEYSSAFRRIGFNQKVIDMYHAQQRGEQLSFPVELHSIRLGDVAMSTNRFEYYLDFGLRIKARSKAVQTFIVQLAGAGTYLPTARSMAGGSYGAYIASTPIGPEGGQQIVENQVKTINKMFEE
jgi:guanylate kinase